MKRPTVRSLFGVTLAVLVVAVAAYAANTLALKAGVEQLRVAAGSRLDMIVATIDGELSRFDYLPALLETSVEIVGLLDVPEDPRRLDRANRYLQSINTAAGSANLFLLDATGRGIASADWNQAGTPIGTDFSFRPYVKDALSYGTGRFYGVGVTSGRPGYYFSHALYRNEVVRAIATVKADLGNVAREWSKLPGSVLLLDGNGVVILSSRPQLMFRPIARPSGRVDAEIRNTRPYGDAELTPLDWQTQRHLSAEVQLATVDGVSYLAAARPIIRTGWQLVVLDELAPLVSGAHRVASMTALALTVLMLVATVLWLYQRMLREKVASRAALQEAHDSLEAKVVERTAELRSANLRLSGEVVARQAVEDDLRATQNELVTAGQMAAFGQMSAGMVHELNQPLAALRTLSDNACTLIDTNRVDRARGNMQRIARIVDRLGRLIYQLKTFAYQPSAPLMPVRVREVINSAQFLVSQRQRESAVEIRVSVQPAEIKVMGDDGRLEQVLVNLMGNAIDAMADSPVRRLTVDAGVFEGRCRITFSDSGPGIRADVLPSLFKPFVTTKSAGSGLGLGLAISAQIVGEFRGRLHAHNIDHGGACFVVELPLPPGECLQDE